MMPRHRYTFIFLIFLAFLGVAGSLFYGHAPAPVASVQSGIAQEFKLTEQRRIHILFGDGTGGGHRYGAGKPGKTEFPKEWDDEKIIDVAKRIANDTTLPMRPSGKRYWIRMGEEDGLQIRVVLDKERGMIITAYPVVGRRN